MINDLHSEIEHLDKKLLESNKSQRSSPTTKSQNELEKLKIQNNELSSKLAGITEKYEELKNSKKDDYSTEIQQLIQLAGNGKESKKFTNVAN